MRVQVTQQHIDRGVKMSHTHCPIALALQDAEFDRPNVGTRYVSVGTIDNDNARYGILPETARDFIFHFDRENWEEIKPFEFCLTLNR